MNEDSVSRRLSCTIRVSSGIVGEEGLQMPMDSFRFTLQMPAFVLAWLHARADFGLMPSRIGPKFSMAVEADISNAAMLFGFGSPSASAVS
jgi:hypothetical protein